MTPFMRSGSLIVVALLVGIGVAHAKPSGLPV